MMKSTLLTAAAFCCVAYAASATEAVPAVASASAVCDQLDFTIVASERQMSAISAAGILDDSAPRATMRAAQTANLIAMVHSNVLLKQANGCPSHTRPVSDDWYMLPAMACETARLRRPGVADLPECDRANWKPLAAAGE
jgi:hypothetical protein